MSQKDQGNQAFKEGNYPRAIQFYTNALAENPSDHTILSNRAAAYQNSSQFAAALADAEKCIELKPDWGKGYQRKAMALQAQGNLEQALEFYETARKYDPNNAQLIEMIEKCGQEMLVNEKGYAKGEMPFGDFFMKGYGREEQNPLGLGGLAKAESDPKVAKWLKEDIMFRN